MTLLVSLAATMLSLATQPSQPAQPQRQDGEQVEQFKPDAKTQAILNWYLHDQ